MSDKTELARLPIVDLAELTRGLYFLFWSLLVFVLALLETLVVPAGQPFPILFLGAGGMGALVGAYRLSLIQGLGPTWQKRTRRLLVVTGLVGYFSLVYLMWRQMPAHWYLLAQVLLFFDLVIVMLGLICPLVEQLARVADRPHLARQSVWFGSLAVLLLVPADLLISRLLVVATQHGRDPLGSLQLWLADIPRWTILSGLVPVALLLSLLWTAKDLTLEALLAKSIPVPQPE